MARVVVQKAKKNEFLKIVNEVVQQTKKNQDCIRFEIFQHEDEENTFSFQGIWYGEEGFIKYLKSDRFLMMLLSFKLLKKTPEIHFFVSNTSIGLSKLLELRTN